MKLCTYAKPRHSFWCSVGLWQSQNHSPWGPSPIPCQDGLEGHSGRAGSSVLHPSRCQQGNLIFTHLLNVQDAGVSTRPVYLKTAFPELG